MNAAPAPEMRAGGPARRALLLAAAALLLALGLLLPALAWSELQLELARQDLLRWWLRPEPVRLERAGRQLDHSALALRRADRFLALGQLRLARALEGEPGGLEAARGAFDRAIAARPGWPESYAWRAVTRARLGDRQGLGEDLGRALARGPGAGGVLLVLASHAGVVAARLDPETREALLVLADRVGRHDPNWTVRVLERLGWHALWCARAAAHRYAQEACVRHRPPATA